MRLLGSRAQLCERRASARISQAQGSRERNAVAAVAERTLVEIDALDCVIGRIDHDTERRRTATELAGCLIRPGPRA